VNAQKKRKGNEDDLIGNPIVISSQNNFLSSQLQGHLLIILFILINKEKANFK
jgi:hypothetical protein